MLIENLKLIDVVVELVDARAPMSTRNPDFDALFAGKNRVVVLNKSDMADTMLTGSWVEWYRAQGMPALSFISTSGSKKAVTALIEEAAGESVRRMKEKGVLKTVRVLVCGIPNVGKSTFINRIAGAARTKVGDKPGVTKGKQWVKITPYLELMDSPGLLWPKLDNEIYARRLAFLGSIKDDVMQVETLSSMLLDSLRHMYPEALRARYRCIDGDTHEDMLLEAVCESRGFLLQGGAPDTLRAARIVLDEFRAGRIVRATLDIPGEKVD